VYVYHATTTTTPLLDGVIAPAPLKDEGATKTQSPVRLFLLG
jgi:hypothetical protein